MTLGHWSASQRLALRLETGTGVPTESFQMPLCPAFFGLKSLGDGPKPCQLAVHKCFHAHKSFITSRDDQTDAFLPSFKTLTFGPANSRYGEALAGLGTPVPAESAHWPDTGH
eukprot:5910006-Prymnesium_polylepis.1